MNVARMISQIIGIEICLVAALGCALLLLKRFAPLLYTRHVCADVQETLPQRCFDCNGSSCAACDFLPQSRDLGIDAGGAEVSRGGAVDFSLGHHCHNRTT